MIANDILVQTKCDRVSFKVRVQPRASRNVVVGVYDHSLKIALTTPPVDGKANSACIAFLANLFCVAKHQVAIIAGDKCKNKVIEISGINEEFFYNTITGILQKN